MGRWGLIAGGCIVLAMSAAPSDAQVRVGIGVSVGPPVYVGLPVYAAPVYAAPVYVDRYYSRSYSPYYRPVRVYPSRTYYVHEHHRHYVGGRDRGYRQDIRRAERAYKRDIRDARRDYRRDIRDARRRR